VDLFGYRISSSPSLSLFLPTDTRGKKRVDDRRVISSIIYVQKIGWAMGRRSG
jgi:hypothetical protein